MHFTVAMGIFGEQCIPQLKQPTIVGVALARPDTRGVVRMGRFIDHRLTVIGETPEGLLPRSRQYLWSAVQKTMGRREELCILDVHFGDMFIEMPGGAFLWVV